MAEASTPATRAKRLERIVVQAAIGLTCALLFFGCTQMPPTYQDKPDTADLDFTKE